MILEMIVGSLLFTGTIGGGTVLGYRLGRKEKQPPLSVKPIKMDTLLEEAKQEVEEFLNPPPIKETVPWSYNYIFGTTKCIKCNSHNRWRGRNYRICSCKDHNKPHFHIQCSSCQHKTIMRSSDDV